MKKTMTRILMTASVLTIVAASAPAMASPSVLCSVRANYEAAGSGADYQPGVDVDGNAVAPADTAEPVMAMPQSLLIPLTVDLAQRMNEVLPDGAKLETEVGVVEVRQDGHVIIDGKDLTGPATSMCNTIEKQKEAALKTKDAPKVKKVAKPVEPIVEEPAVTEPEITEPVAPEAAPVEEPVVEQPQAEAVPAPAEPAVVEAPPAAPEPTPQVLEPAPAPAPETAPITPTAPELPEPVAPAPTTELVPADPAVAVPQEAEVISPATPDEAIVSPTEGDMVPRPPMDPLAGGAEPPPPAPMNNDGMMSGGAQ